MQYLLERAAYSTLTVNVEVQQPTATPVMWQPEKTVEAASDRLSGMLHGLGDLAIWLSITVVPFAIPAALISVGAWHWKRKQKKS